MSSPDQFRSSLVAEEIYNESKFTFRDLRHLGQASVTSPLRVIALIDFDAFYAQCETVRLGLPPTVPLAVQQWEAIIALSYAARESGIRRGIPAKDAKLKCPDLVLQHVATWREGEIGWAYRSDMEEHMGNDKAALDPYRLESRKAFDIVKKYLPPEPPQKVEKASVDEIFLDLSMQVHNELLKRYPELLVKDTRSLDARLPPPYSSLIDWHTQHVFSSELLGENPDSFDWDDVTLAIGSEIVQGIRKEIFAKLSYTTSAGIARNKVLAKLAAGHNKPNQQTIVRSCGIGNFLADYKFTKIRGLGGKLGVKVKDAFRMEKVSELLSVSIKEMKAKLGPESGSWVFNVIRGNEYAEVISRVQIQTMLSAKTFTSPLTSIDQAHSWLRIFIGDLIGRISEISAESGIRRPRTIAVNHHVKGRFGPTRSKQRAIPPGSPITMQNLFALAKSLLADIAQEGPICPCISLSMNLSDFEDDIRENHRITSFLVAESPSGKRRKIDTHPHIRTSKSQEQPASHTMINSDLFAGRSPVNRESMTTNGRQIPPWVSLSDNRPQGEIVSASIEELRNDQGHEAGYQCPNCNTTVAAAEVLEHLDWHVAMELQKSDGSQA